MAESTTTPLKPVKVAEGLYKLKLASAKPVFKIGVGKKHAATNTLFLEIQGNRKFEIGNDCDTCHFWFKLLQEPKSFAEKKTVNLPKAVSIPRPVDPKLIKDLTPLLDLMDKGTHYVFNTHIDLAGPYKSDDEESYFHNNEFLEIWDIEDPASEDVLSNWEHYEGKHPKVFRHGDIMEKLYEFIVPLVPNHKLKQENVRLYHEMIKSGDRPRILLLGMIQRAVPESVATGQLKTLHSFFSGFVLDGHHKLAAYRRAGVPANALVILADAASKYHLLPSEGNDILPKLEERLATLADVNEN
jgi:hypothetical protein